MVKDGPDECGILFVERAGVEVEAEDAGGRELFFREDFLSLREWCLFNDGCESFEGRSVKYRPYSKRPVSGVMGRSSKERFKLARGIGIG
jgi:hypothetical protein